MNWRNLPNPSEPADSQIREEAILRVFKHIENTKELSEEDKAEFLHCLYVFVNRWMLDNSAGSVRVLEKAGLKLFSNK